MAEFFYTKVRYLMQVIYNTSALVQVMTWRRTSDKPFPEPPWTKFDDAMWRS